MTRALLLDEMLSPDIAGHVRARGYDVAAVASNPRLVGLPDAQIVAASTDTDRAVVTANVKDFAGLDGEWRLAVRSHAGILLVGTPLFPQNRSFVGALVEALSAQLDETGDIVVGQVIHLRPHLRSR